MPTFHVQRSIQIAASQQQVFEKLSDFNTWTTWLPWLLAEPKAKVTVANNAQGVGAIYAWDGKIVEAATFETYKTSPLETPEAECVTEIYRPLRS